MFRGQKPQLMKRSPMLLSVPIGGTETVTGLRPMAYGQDSGVTHDEVRLATKVHSSPPAQEPRSFYKHYKGPFLESLTKDAWQKPPKSWRHFFYGQTSELVYNVPEDTKHLQERIEENLVTYLSNYIWLIATILLCFLVFNWAASFGVASVCVAIWLNVEFPPPPARAQHAVVEDQWAGVRAGATVVAWLLVLYTRCTTLLIKWAGVSLIAVLSHASLRCTFGEGNTSTGSRGVPFALFLSDVQSPEYSEPRKVVYEISAVVQEQSRLLWNQAKFYSYYLLDAVRYPYVLYHHASDHHRTH
ncbi:hypothetical protein ABBQ32_005298 [Trebouxia sp. C0010 RCD-2024]